MAITFSRLLEAMQHEEEQPKQDTAKNTIRTGLNLRSVQCGSFWDDFLRLCGDVKGMSEILDVPSHKISIWHKKIRDLIAQVNKEDSQGEEGGKAIMISTGDDEPTTLSNPNGADYPGSTPPDTRPMP